MQDFGSNQPGHTRRLTNPVPMDKHSILSTPSPRAVDKPNASMPQILPMTREYLAQSFGYLGTNKIIRLLSKTSKKTIRIHNEHSPNLDPGSAATMHSNKRNTTPLERASTYSAKWHMDIGFGPTTAIGGIKYCLLLVDSYSRLKLTYGLTNLTTSLISALKRFKIDAQAKIGEIRTNFERKKKEFQLYLHVWP